MDSIPFYDLTIAQPCRMLTNLSIWLEKAKKHLETRKMESDHNEFLHCRLVVDQYPLVRQVQISCDTAKMSAARLSGKEAPKHPDTEKTFEELQKRIQSTLAFLKSIKPEDFKGAGARKLQFPWMEGKYIEAPHALVQLNIPNFYFHVTTAYAILRANGVDLGKEDYMGADLPFKAL